MLENLSIDLNLLDNVAVCDGSCLKNPGPGGWAVVHIKDGQTKSYSGSKQDTTNNIMELAGIIVALKLKPKTIYSDSTYCVNGINSWLRSWKLYGWKNARKEPVKNLESWQEIDKLLYPGLTVKWIKGHAAESDAVDQLSLALIKLQNYVDHLARASAKLNHNY